jgi:hypothetical protein
MACKPYTHTYAQTLIDSTNHHHHNLLTDEPDEDDNAPPIVIDAEEQLKAQKRGSQEPDERTAEHYKVGTSNS